MATRKSCARMLTEVPRLLRNTGFEPPPYRAIRDAAVDGLFPAFKFHGLWYFKEADLPAIEAALKRKRARDAAKDARHMPADDAKAAISQAA